MEKSENTKLQGFLYEINDIYSWDYSYFIIAFKEKQTKNLISIKYSTENEKRLELIHDSLKKQFSDYHSDEKKPKLEVIIKGHLDEKNNGI